MKKITLFLLAFVLSFDFAIAKPVNPQTAQTAAANFYRLTMGSETQTISLSYTGLSASGKAVYYVFTINNSGFIIMSADDAAQPVIGYSAEDKFSIPDAKSNIGIWLRKRGEEINYIMEQHLNASERIAGKWNSYLNNSTQRMGNQSIQSTVAPICQTKWNQSPYYNAMCPGGSVTGCVATAMAQIMRYWSYPLHGIGQSSYNSTYGTLSANYGAATYNWSNMPMSISSNNSDVALINYHCGVSVEMDYSPSSSGAWVCSFDDPVCAQNSYVQYFGYDPNTIQGLARSNYDDSTWKATLKTDINIGRPVQYAGWDPNEGGHTWVCDGYDQNDFFHMNWGWGGSSNGYYDINMLNPSGLNFSDGHEAVTGIVPIAPNVVDAGIPLMSSPAGYYCNNNSLTPSIKLQNYGGNTLTSCVINYQLDNGTPQTYVWNGSLIFGQYTMISLPAFTPTVGSHTLVCYSSNPNGAVDANAGNDQYLAVFHISQPGVLPVAEGFESCTLPGTNWAVSNSGGSDWSITSAAAATGINSAKIDNSTNTPGNVSVLQTTSTFNVAQYSNPVLSFKMAYQPKLSTNNDMLQVFVSTDCGSFWAPRWTHHGAALATVNGTSNNFTPSAGDFVTYTVNINNVLTSHSVSFRWVFTADANGPGNDIFIDDINLTDAVTGIQTQNINSELNVYPNPSSGQMNIACALSQASQISAEVIDVLGRNVESIPSKLYPAGDLTIGLGKNKAYDTGIYFVNVYIDGKKISKKVIVE